MGKQSVQVVAHRGMGQGFVQPDAPPENTLPAFMEGWKIARACELDGPRPSRKVTVYVNG